MCKVSIVVPNYNYARYLPARINSILNQEFQDFELILLDDASTDNSRQILHSYRHNPHVSHIVVNKENTGSPFRQWLKGISLSRGEYIWIAESDDLCKPDFLSVVVDILDNHPEAAYCFAGSTHIDENGNELPFDMNKWGAKEKNREYAVFSGIEYAAHNLYWRCYIANASAAIFRKSSFINTDPEQFSQMKSSGDWLFWFNMSMQGAVIEVYRVLNYFRQHTSKVTVKAHHNGQAIKEDMEIIGKMEQELPSIGLYKRAIRRGILYNRIKKLPATPQVKSLLYSMLKHQLHTTATHGLLAHINHILRFVCPVVINMKRDRLHPK